jgi:hypothetical protein
MLSVLGTTLNLFSGEMFLDREACFWPMSAPFLLAAA